MNYDALQTWEREYREGKKEALLRAVAHCLHHCEIPPDWARRAFIDACWSGAGPWEDDFGHRRSNEDFQKEFLLARKRRAVFRRVEELRQEQPVDAALFERVGKELGVSGATVSSLYYNDTTRLQAADDDWGEAVNQAMDRELGPAPDERSKDLWWEKNAQRVEEMWKNALAATSKKRPGNSGRVISKKAAKKIKILGRVSPLSLARTPHWRRARDL